MSAKSGKLGRTPFAILGALTALLLGVSLLLVMTVGDTKRDLAQARREYRQMYDRKMDVLKNPIQTNAAVVPDDVGDLTGFFEAQRTQRGIAKAQMPATSAFTKSEVPETPWTRWACRIDFHGSKDSSLDKKRVVDFLAEVERAKPYLKSTRVLLRMREGKFVDEGVVTFSYYRKRAE